MLKRTNNDRLHHSGIDSKYYLFVQLWKEMTCRRTLDSYQFRIMNSLNCLNELHEVVGLKLSGFHASDKNILECMAETSEIIGRDSVLRKHYLPIWVSLKKHLSKKPSNDSQLRALLYQIDYCYKAISQGYLENLLAELELDIAAADNDGVCRKTNALISCCVTMGWSTPSLCSMIDALEGSESFDSKWRRFKDALLHPSSVIYKVYVPFNLNYRASRSDKATFAKTVRNEIVGLGIQIVSKDLLLKDAPELNPSLFSNDEYLLVSVQAFDPWSACYKAIDRFSDALNLFSFYNYIEPWDMEKERCWVIDCDTPSARTLRFDELYSRPESVLVGRRNFKATKKLLGNPHDPLSRKLASTFTYSNMSKAASSQEERFMNCWVALESLCRVDAYDNIISSVLAVVPPAMCARYIHRLFRNFIEDCSRCGVSLSFSEIGYAFSDNAPWDERVEKVIETLNNDAAYKNLLTACKVNALLQYRCEEMRVLATDAQCMFNRIKAHCDTVRRQIARLYRVRNGIAHTGATSIDSLAIYTEHLEGYLTSFVSEVAITAVEMDESSAEVVFEAIKDNYEVFVDIASNKNQANRWTLLSNVLSTGAIKMI